jgi:flagellar biosynthesis regulator FlbT
MDEKERNAGLLVEIGPRNPMLINGALIKAAENTKIMVMTRSARVLRGNMIMTEEAATTETRKLYLCFQHAYMESADVAKRHALFLALRLVEIPATLKDVWPHVLELAEAGKWYEALRTMRPHFETLQPSS